MNIEIANRLLQLRKEKGLSQEQLAQELGISRQAVSKWERAEASPDTDNLIQLAKIYDVSLDELLLHNPSDKKEATEESEEQVEYKTGINVESDDGDKVHVGFDGIHVREKHGDDVHITWKGIHVKEAEGHKVDIDENGIYVDDEVYNHDEWKHHIQENKKYDFPFTALIFFGYLIYMCYTGHWHPGWIVLLVIPLFDSLMTAMRKKKFSEFAYPILTVAIYLWLGFTRYMWHPGWVIFLTIPCYYIIANYIDHKIKNF